MWVFVNPKSDVGARMGRRWVTVEHRLRSAGLPLYSRKLHIRVLRASTSCETSLMILAFSLGESVVNHFASRYGRTSEHARLSAEGACAYHFALPREEDEIAVSRVNDAFSSRSGSAHNIPDRHGGSGCGCGSGDARDTFAVENESTLLALPFLGGAKSAPTSAQTLSRANDALRMPLYFHLGDLLLTLAEGHRRDRTGFMFINDKCGSLHARFQIMSLFPSSAHLFMCSIRIHSKSR